MSDIGEDKGAVKAETPWHLETLRGLQSGRIGNPGALELVILPWRELNASEKDL